MAAARHCLSLLLLSTCVALLLQPPLGASEYRVKPVPPGDDATQELKAQYVTAFCRYINKVLTLHPPLGASEDPVKPVSPGVNATLAQNTQYAIEVCRYIKKGFTPRYEKRDQEDTLSFLEELGQMDV